MTFIIATHNTKKLLELQRILAPLQIDALSADEARFPLDEVEETGTTFEKNALLKARAACEATGMPAVADDSGLMVDALNGAPGVYSARYAGEGATDAMRIEKLLYEMQNVPKEKRTSRFVSVACCVFPNGESLVARGECEGTIAFESKGTGGFGYDPVFLVEDGHSFAELSAEQKDAISHRGKSLHILQQKLKEKFNTEKG